MFRKSPLAYVGYWCSLGSSQAFTGQTLESCVNVIHEDIINVWNFEDTERVCHPFLSSALVAEVNQYLLNRDFKARMTRLVGDLA
jgi:hypothetical protein